MTIKVGDKIPSVKLKQMTPGRRARRQTDDLFKGKKVVLFALPGAFTPTCSAKHLPGFVEKAGELKAKGVDTIACLVGQRRLRDERLGQGPEGRTARCMMLADGNGDFTTRRRARDGRQRLRHGQALAALRDGRRQRRRQGAQCREARRLRGVERRSGDEGALSGVSHPDRRCRGAPIRARCLTSCRAGAAALPRRRSGPARRRARSRGGRQWPLTQNHSTRAASPRLEPLPEIDVLHRLLVGGLPAARLPGVDEVGDAVAQVLAVGVDTDRGTAASAPRAPAIAAIISMRLLVVGLAKPVQLALDARRSAGSRPSRRGRDCRCRRRR